MNKFQVTIPKRVGEEFNLKEGDTIVFSREGNKLLIVKSTDI
ncbi:AbrB/MazE/SpoVT family DNA-binding domain-containing protein [Archaeoglobus sp.]